MSFWDTWIAPLNGNLFVATWVYHRWIEDHPKPLTNDLVVVPRVDEGTAIPLVYGQVRVRSPILVWSGNHLVPDQSYPSFIGGGTHTADHFSIDALFLLGVPFYGGSAAMTALLAGDVLMTGSGVGISTGTYMKFAFGPSPAAPGDLVIDGILYQGSTITGVNNNVTITIAGDVWSDSVQYGGTSGLTMFNQAGMDLTLIPDYRSQLVALMHIGIGLTPNIPSFSFIVTALSTGTPSDMGQSLALDADPAAVLFDLLTSPFGKLALPVSKIDLPSFQAASLILFSEGHGYSRVIDQATDAQSIIAEILRQIDGLIYIDPTSGKLVLKLIRNDYDPLTLDDINPDNIVVPAGGQMPSGWYSVSGSSETMNQVRVTFTDRAQNYSNGLAFGQNTSNIIGQGLKVRALELSFPGCCTAATAQQIASRELAVASRPMARVTVQVNRTLYAKRPGDVVTLTYPPLGISGMILRIATVDLGQLHDGKITLNMVRDVFDQKLGAYPVPPLPS